MRYGIAILVFLALIVSIGFAYDLSDCSVISSPGYYQLTSDVVGSPISISPDSKACIVIHAPSVTFDCNGHTITGDEPYNDSYGTSGIYVNQSSGVTVQNCPGISGYEMGVLPYSSSNNVINNITVFDSWSGVWPSGSGYAVISNSFFYNLSACAVGVAWNSGHTTIENNIAHDVACGFGLGSGSYNTVLNNTVYNGTGDYGIYADSSTSYGNNIINNTVQGFAEGIYLILDSDYNNVIGNTVYGSSDACILVQGGQWNYVQGNTVHDCLSGIEALHIPVGVVMADNTVFNSSYAFAVERVSNGIIINNTVRDNPGSGFVLWGDQYAISQNNYFESNTAYNNSAWGFYAVDSENTWIAGLHLFNNGPDFMLGSTGAVTPNMYVHIEGLALDSPAGNFSNYTNLSMAYTIPVNSSYSISWSGEPAAPPSAVTPFAQKYVNISPRWGDNSIDSLTWQWNEDEISGGGYNESNLFIFEYSGGGWSRLGGTLDTMAHTLTLSPLTPSSVYGIMQVDDLLPPTVSLNSPDEGHTFNSSPAEFNFTATDDNATVMRCSIFIDGVLRQTNASVLNGTPTVFEVHGIHNGGRNWYVSCRDEGGNTGYSETRNFTMDHPSGCAVVGSPGATTMSQDGEGAPYGFLGGKACVVISASDVLFDCGGYYITNYGTPGASGIALNGSLTNVTVQNCPSVSGYAYGVYSYQSSGSALANITAHGNTQSGFYVYSGAGNALSNDTAYNNSPYGFHLNDSSGNSITGSSAHDNSETGFYLDSASGNSLADNSAYGNPNYGFYLDASSGNNLTNNTAYSNSNTCFYLNSASDNVLSGDSAHDTDIGFYLSASSGNNISGSEAYNAGIGFDLYSGSGNRLSNDEAYNNTNDGTLILDSDLTTLSGEHYHANSVDLSVGEDTGGTITYNATGIIFDNPAAGYQNFTNLSISDSLSNEGYYALWYAEPGPLPGGARSFEQKYVAIYTNWGSPSIDSITWHYNESEVSGGGYNESILGLFGYDWVHWATVNITPDLARHELGYSGLAPNDIFGILEYIPPPPCPAPINESGYYQLNESVGGASNPTAEVGGSACVVISAPDVVFDCDGFNISDDGAHAIGIFLNDSATNVTVENCPGIQGYGFGFYIYNAENNLFRNNTVRGSTFYGFYLGNSPNNSFVDNLALDTGGWNGHGFHLSSGSNYNNLTNNTASNNSEAGFYLDSGTEGNVLANNTAAGNNNEGFYVYWNSNDAITGNSAYGTVSGLGFFIYVVSYSNVSDNEAYNNSGDGFSLYSGWNNNISGNRAYNNTNSGFNLNNFRYSSIENNSAHNNLNGFFMYGTHDNNFSGDSVYGNSQQGTYLQDSDSNTFAREHYYNNNPDLQAEEPYGNPYTVNMSGMIFDSPSGTYADYTNLSIYDYIGSYSAYTINWSGEPAALPENRTSFRQKFVNITPMYGSISIDSMTWHWTDGELVPPYDETTFELWEYGPSGWSPLNASPDLSAHTLGMANLAPESDYAILQNNMSGLEVVISSPPDGSSLNSSVTISGNCKGPGRESAWTNDSLFSGVDATPAVFSFTNTSAMQYGNRTVTVYCNATNGSVYSASVSFFWAAPPVISVVIISPPSNISALPGSSFLTAARVTCGGNESCGNATVALYKIFGPDRFYNYSDGKGHIAYAASEQGWSSPWSNCKTNVIGTGFESCTDPMPADAIETPDGNGTQNPPSAFMESLASRAKASGYYAFARFVFNVSDYAPGSAGGASFRWRGYTGVCRNSATWKGEFNQGYHIYVRDSIGGYELIGWNTTPAGTDLTDDSINVNDFESYINGTDGTMEFVVEAAQQSGSGGPCGGSSVETDYVELELAGRQAIPMDPPAAPFFTGDQNPIYPENLSCLENMDFGTHCDVSWNVNVSENATFGINDLAAWADSTDAGSSRSGILGVDINNGTGGGNISVSLDSPVDGYNASRRAITFNCSANSSTGLSHITLYGNFSGGWDANQTNDVSGESASTEFTLNLSYADYVWNCLAYDTDGNSAWAPANYTFTADSLPRASDFGGRTTDFNSELDLQNVSAPILENTTHGILQWNGSGLDVAAADFNSYVLFGTGWVSVDSSHLSSTLDSPANITLYNLPNEYMPILYSDGAVCSDCEILSYLGHDFIFTVQHFTNYSAGPNTNLAIYDQYEGSNVSKLTNITFYANYTNATDGSHVAGATCTISFDDATSGTMADTGTQYNYTKAAGFSTTGIHLWNATCNETGYETLFAQDDVNVGPLNLTGNQTSLYMANVTNATALPRFVYNSTGNLSSEGGNITGSNINTEQLTDRWAAFYGNITGSIMLTDKEGANNVYQWGWTPTDGGVVCTSTNSSVTDLTLYPADGDDIDAAWGFAPTEADSGRNTFNQTGCGLTIGTTPITNAGYADTGQAGGFITCSLKDTIAAAKPDMFFCTNITQNGVFWNNELGDFELMVPTAFGDNVYETYYFYVNLD